MNIPADLARQLLETDFENVCAKLKAGATLTSAERTWLQENAARRASSPEAPSPPSAPDPAPPRQSFILQPGAPLPAKLRDYYLKTLREYEPTYQRGERTIKRWVSVGRNASPPEPPPLDAPASMADWYRKHVDAKNVPAVLLELERSAPRATAPSPPTAPERETTPAPDPADFVFQEGQALRRARQIEAANGAKVEAAQRNSDDDEYARWFPKWVESSTLLKQLEREHRESCKANAAWIPRAPILTELAQIFEAQRLMRMAMPVKVEAEMGRRATGRIRRVLRLIAPLLRDSIAAVRSREDDILRNIEGLRSPGDAESAFTLDAA